MLNERFLDKLNERWMKKKLHCSKIEDQQDGIAISNIGGVFVVILVGIVLAIFTLIFEFFWFQYYKKPIRHIDVVEYGVRNSNLILVSHSSTVNARHPKASTDKRVRSRTINNIQIADIN